MKNKIVSAAEPVAIIRAGDTVSVAGFVGIGTPDELLIALEARFREMREPAGLTLVFAAAPGDGRDRGLNRLAHPGLVKRAIGGHWSLVPKLAKLAMDGEMRPTTCRWAASRSSTAISRRGGRGCCPGWGCGLSWTPGRTVARSTPARPRTWSSC